MRRKPKWRTACKDWERRIVAGESLIPFAPLFPSESDRAQEVFGALTMVDAVGSPLMSETVRPWVTDIVGVVFGSYEPEEGRRLVNEFMVLISKKNGKSTIAAGVMLTALILNWRASGEFIILAPTKEVADNSYKPIRDMINADEELKALFQVQDHLRTVTHWENKATLKVVAADSETVSGKKAIGVFVDELHEFGKHAKAANMLLEATGGLASRPEGFVIYATTQSDAPPAGVFKQKLDYARKVRDGLIDDPTFMPILYEFPESMLKAGTQRNIENAYITNPNWGLSVDAAFIEKKHKQAIEDGEDAFRVFLAKHLNVEIGLGLRSNRWAGADFWERRGEIGLTLESVLERSDVVVFGIDGGGLDDMLGAAAIGREIGTGNWLHWAHAWVHPIALERNKASVSKFEDFQKAGELTIVQNLGEDMEELADYVEQCEKSGLLDRVGLDPAAVGDIVDVLQERKLGGDRIVGISQGWKMTSSIKTTERKLAEGAMSHGATGLMAWCVGNAKVEPRGNAIVITKQTAGQAKIDPLMATFNAAALMALNPAPRKKKSMHMFVVG